MKIFFISIFTFLLLYRMNGQSLYDLNQIQEIKITFPTNNWDQKLDSLHAADSDARLIATRVELNGVLFDSVGIRYKGNSTYNPTRNKNPFNIKLDYIKTSQNYEGYNTLKLSSGFMDPSFLREVMGYKISRQYLPAPKANFINVFVNNVLIGLYTNVEDVDNNFLSKHFYSNDQSFFQCDRSDKQVQLPPTCPAGNPGSALKYISPDSSCYFNNYELESASGWKKLLNLMITLNQDINQIEKFLDVDRALWMLALNNFYVNLDSYSGSGHNYLIYENKLGRFNTIPWDLNEYYGAFTNAGTGAQLTLLQMQQLDPLLHLNNIERPLISKLFSVPKFKKRYLAHLLTIITEAKNSKAYEQDALDLQNLIAPSVTKDINKFFSEAAFKTNLYNDFTNTGGMGGKTYPGLISLVNARINYLGKTTVLNVVQPTIDQIQYTPKEIHKNDLLNFTAKINHAKKTSFFFRYNKEAAFNESAMYDDGLHQDGASGDGIYGCTIAMDNHLEIQYYIYAENDSIAAVSPPRAEYEFYNLRVPPAMQTPGEILLNELVASNTQIQDENGEYDDWVELYNTTDRAISCYGLYLSDDPENKLKWTFPDTIINSKSYLIVWADEDGNDPGLHSNFKLSKSGEFLSLYNIDSLLFDTVHFPALIENQSFGRCNGVWDYTNSVTFANTNDCKITYTDDKSNKDFTVIYPNPFFESIHLNFKKKLPISMLITDIFGKEIYSDSKLASDHYSILTSNWSSGCYIIYLFYSNHTFISKLINK